MIKLRSKVLWRIGTRACVIYFVVCVFVFVFQRSLLFFPTHQAETGQLDAWTEGEHVVGYCRERTNPATVWLMCHGNGGQASDRDYVLKFIPDSDSVYVLEYPGYGDRSGSPSRMSIDLAATEAYEILCRRYPDIPLGVIGESLGSGPACALTSSIRPPEKVVLIVPFDTLHRIASRRFPFLPVWLLLLDRWDNIQSLSRYQGPVEIYGARDDKVIPCSHARRLADSHTAPGIRS